MKLIERWRNIDDAEIIRETQLLFLNCSNAVNLFTVDGNNDMIRYCCDHSQNTEIDTYGKATGICYSEKTARDAIKQVITDYIFLLLPFLRGELPTLDFGIKGLKTPIGYYQNANGEEIEIREAVFVFEKCDNQAGFCVSKVIPLREKYNTAL